MSHPRARCTDSRCSKPMCCRWHLCFTKCLTLLCDNLLPRFVIPGHLDHWYCLVHWRLTDDPVLLGNKIVEEIKEYEDYLLSNGPTDNMLGCPGSKSWLGNLKQMSDGLVGISAQGLRGESLMEFERVRRIWLDRTQYMIFPDVVHMRRHSWLLSDPRYALFGPPSPQAMAPQQVIIPQVMVHPFNQLQPPQQYMEASCALSTNGISPTWHPPQRSLEDMMPQVDVASSQPMVPSTICFTTGCTISASWKETYWSSDLLYLYHL